MARSRWHKLYSAHVAASPATLFGLLADMPNYGRWLGGSAAFGQTTDVEPYPVRLGSRYHDGKPGEPGKDWWGTVTGFQPPGSLDFQHTIHVNQLRATVDVYIHYSLEPRDHGTQLTRWLLLDTTIPILLYPLKSLVIRSFDKENVRTIAAVKEYAEGQHTNPSRTGSTAEASSNAPAVSGKGEMEFFNADMVPWTAVPGRQGLSERILARDPERGLVTRMVRWDPGFDSSDTGPVAHEHFEEVLILSGSMRDLGLQQTFSAGSYACRPPGMVHGPWTAAEGCVMLEVQHAG